MTATIDRPYTMRDQWRDQYRNWRQWSKGASAPAGVPRAINDSWLARLRSIMILRPGQRHVMIPGYGVTARAGRNTLHAGGASWWLAGGAPTPVAVYQPRGAADKAASLLDLIGTRHLTENGTVTWSAINGWSGWSAANFLNNTGAYLSSGTAARSVVVRISGGSLTTQRPIANLGGVSTVNYASFALTPEVAVRIYFGNRLWASSATGSAVLAVTGPASGKTSDLIAYIDGSALSVTSTSDQSYNTSDGLQIGGSVPAAGVGNIFDGNVLAVAVYEAVLTPEQTSAVSAAVAAL